MKITFTTCLLALAVLLNNTAQAQCTPPPAPNAIDTVVICNGNTVTLFASGLGTLSWYANSVGGTVLDTGVTLITGALTNNTVFYVQDSTCAPSATRSAVMVNQIITDTLTTIPYMYTTDTTCLNTTIDYSFFSQNHTITGPGVTNNVFDASTVGVGSYMIGWTNYVSYIDTLYPCVITVGLQQWHKEVWVRDCLVGLNKHSIANSVIVPNPNNGTFTITTPNTGMYTLTNELGQVVNVFTNSTTITGLASGVYILNNTAKATHQKIVVTN